MGTALPNESELVIKRGTRLANIVMAKVERDHYTVLDTAYAAQVMLTHCREAMRKVNAAEWNEYIDGLVRDLKIDPPAVQ